MNMGGSKNTKRSAVKGHSGQSPLFSQKNIPHRRTHRKKLSGDVSGDVTATAGGVRVRFQGTIYYMNIVKEVRGRPRTTRFFFFFYSKLH